VEVLSHCSYTIDFQLGHVNVPVFPFHLSITVLPGERYPSSVGYLPDLSDEMLESNSPVYSFGYFILLLQVIYLIDFPSRSEEVENCREFVKVLS